MQRQPATSTLRQLARKTCSQLLFALLAVAVTGLPLFIAAPAQAVTDQQANVCPTNAVGMRPGDNLQNIVSANPAGSTFCLAAGTYQNQSIRPRTGDVYIGQSGAVMDGGGTTRFAFKSIFEPNSRNPIKNVTIRGLTIQRYASQTSIKGFISPEGAIEGGEGWIIENNVIQNNVNGISLGNANWAFADGAIIRNNRILNNSEVGLEVNGSNILFEGNELAGNGWSLNDQDRTWAGGGSKFTDQPIWADQTFKVTTARARTANDHLIIRNNNVHDNVGIGLWLDVYNQNAIVENNLVENNYGSGIMDELSNGTVMRNNTVRNNRKGNSSGGLWGGGEILIANSQRGDVSGNNITVSGSGRAVIMIYETYRSQWPSRDYYVHHNTIRFQNTPQYASDGNPIAGVLGGGGNDPFWTSNNRYDYNTYYVSDANQKFWFWGQGYNWTGFKGRGHEANGLCYYGAGNTPCTAGQAVAPTATSVPATATRVPPTATAVPPTATSVPPTATAVPPTATSVPSSGDGAPYRGQPLPIPGRIEAEDFNLGANGSAYRDNTAGHAEGAVYRTDVNDVDLKASAYGGYALGWFEAGEWLNYSVNVTQAGYYDVVLFGGTVENARTVRLLVNGQDVSGAVAVPLTAAWGTYTQFSAPRIYLDAGAKTLRLANDTGFFDIDWIEFRAASTTATAVPPTTVPPTTVPPTVVPPTATSVPPQQGASVRAVLATGVMQPGGAGRVDVILDNPQLAGGGVRALEARCAIAPAGVVSGQVVTASTLFGPDPVMVNAGVQADSTWVYAVSQSGANPAITAGGVLFSLNLSAVAPGSAALTCTISIIDANRATATLPFAADAITVAQAAPTSAPATATMVPPTATPTLTATATAVPATTAPTLTATATNIPRGQAKGQLSRSHGSADSIAVTVLGTEGAMVAAGVTAADGSFLIPDIPAGTYTIRAEAPGYLPAEGPLIITGGQATEKAPLTLVAGYLVAKAQPCIDELDVVQLAASYGQAVPPAAQTSDLNEDGTVNLPDLSALADNLRATGPTQWP